MKASKKLELLRSAPGVEVHVKHLRRYVPPNNKFSSGLEQSPFGGLTEVILEVHDGSPTNAVRIVGAARCADEDQFDKRIGLEIALGRALHQLWESAGAGEIDISALPLELFPRAQR